MAEIHSPPPWHASRLDPVSDFTIEAGDSGPPVAEHVHPKNAPIIAAAPDMLRELRAWRAWVAKHLSRRLHPYPEALLDSTTKIIVRASKEL